MARSGRTAQRTEDLSRSRTGPRWSRERIVGGGTDGNEQLTVSTGVILFVLLGVLGVTIVRIHPLIFVHRFWACGWSPRWC